MTRKTIRSTLTLLLPAALALATSTARADPAATRPRRSTAAPALAPARPAPPAPARHRGAHTRSRTATRAAATSHMVTVEIEERRGQGGVERRVLRLSLLGRRGARIELHDVQLDDELELHLDSSEAGHAALSLSLDRTRPTAKGRSTRVRLGVSQRLGLGRRALMTGVDLSGGGRLEIYATVR